MSITTVYIAPKRSLGGLVADCVLEEQHVDRSVITEHPVEDGSVVADHAYDLPAELMLTYGWSMNSSQNPDSPSVFNVPGQVITSLKAFAGGTSTFLRDIYEKLRALKSAASPLTVYTGKRTYNNMLIESISISTDMKTENALVARVLLREVIIVSTQVFTVPADKTVVAQPEKSSGTVTQGNLQLQPGTNFADPTAYNNGFGAN